MTLSARAPCATRRPAGYLVRGAGATRLLCLKGLILASKGIQIFKKLLVVLCAVAGNVFVMAESGFRFADLPEDVRQEDGYDDEDVEDNEDTCSWDEETGTQDFV